MLTVDGLVTDCLAALRSAAGPGAVVEVLRGAMANTDDVERALGPITAAGETTLFASPDLTVARLVWAPGMAMYPHDHRMWAAIAVYRGAERNLTYRRTNAGLASVDCWELRRGEVALLDADAIHSVVNPVDRCSAALHVFGGDFVHQPRSEWDWETLTERPYDDGHVQRLFDSANATASRRRAPIH